MTTKKIKELAVGIGKITLLLIWLIMIALTTLNDTETVRRLFTVKPNSSYHKKSVKNPYRIKIRFFYCTGQCLGGNCRSFPAKCF